MRFCLKKPSYFWWICHIDDSVQSIYIETVWEDVVFASISLTEKRELIGLSTIQNPGSTIRDPPSGIHYPESTIQNPLYGIHYPGSTIQNPLSRIHYPESTIQDELSRIHYPLSRIHYIESIIQDPPSRIQERSRNLLREKQGIIEPYPPTNLHCLCLHHQHQKDFFRFFMTEHASRAQGQLREEFGILALGTTNNNKMWGMWYFSNWINWAKNSIVRWF